METQLRWINLISLYFFLFKTKTIMDSVFLVTKWLHIYITKSACTRLNTRFPCFFNNIPKNTFCIRHCVDSRVQTWVTSSVLKFVSLLTRSMHQTLFTYAFSHWRTRIWRRFWSIYRDAFLFILRAVLIWRIIAIPYCGRLETPL